MTTLFARCGGVLVLLLASACLGAPSDAQLGPHGDITATSERGLVDAHLEVVGRLATGLNDFHLTLIPRDSGRETRLQGFRAIMPAHGHATTPEHVAGDSNDYSIAALPLGMPGRWRLTAALLVGDRTDSVVFDLDVP